MPILSIGSSFDFSYTNALTNQQFIVCGVIANEKQEKGKQFYILTADSFRMAFAVTIYF